MGQESRRYSFAHDLHSNNSITYDDRRDDSVEGSSFASTTSIIRSHNRLWDRRPKFLHSSFWYRDNIAFGTPLSEHVKKIGKKIPRVVSECTYVIEHHGCVSGIYRQCGMQSNIKWLKKKFDSGQWTHCMNPEILQDIHSLASVLKLYFRELPDPLFTRALYGQILEAYESENRIENIRQVFESLPGPHYVTAKALMSHLSRMASKKDLTGMSASNLSVVWGPNLFGSIDTVFMKDPQAALFEDIVIHKNLCNFFIIYCNEIFDDLGSGGPNANPEDIQEEKEIYASHMKHVTKNKQLSRDSGMPSRVPKDYVLPNNEEKSKKFKGFTRHSSLQQSLTKFWNRRRREPKTSTATMPSEPVLTRQSFIPAERPRVRRSSSMFSNVTKPFEAFGETVSRHFRNLSVRQSNTSSNFRNGATRRERRLKQGLAEVMGSLHGCTSAQQPDACEDLISNEHPQNLSPTSISSSFNGVFNFEPKLITPAIEKNAKISRLSEEPASTVDDFKQFFGYTPKRVAFCDAEPAEQIISEFTNTADMYDDESKTDCSSVDSIPLDISRYDNVVIPPKPEVPVSYPDVIPSPTARTPSPSVYDDIKDAH